MVFYFPQKTLFDEAATFECGYDSLGDAVDLKNEAQQTIVPYEDILNEPIKNIDPNKPMIALTFDDGPSKRYTPAILDALKEYGANATFFVLGSNADNFPDILQRMVLEGNEIGNHTYSHKQLTTLSKENIEEEIMRRRNPFMISHIAIRMSYGRLTAVRIKRLWNVQRENVSSPGHWIRGIGMIVMQRLWWNGFSSRYRTETLS